jgi:hypothetical protein
VGGTGRYIHREKKRQIERVVYPDTYGGGKQRAYGMYTIRHEEEDTCTPYVRMVCIRYRTYTRYMESGTPVVRVGVHTSAREGSEHKTPEKTSDRARRGARGGARGGARVGAMGSEGGEREPIKKRGGEKRG